LQHLVLLLQTSSSEVIAYPHSLTVDKLTLNDSCYNRQLRDCQICRGPTLRDFFSGHFTTIFFSRDGCLQPLNVCHRLLRVSVTGYHRSQSFDHVGNDWEWVHGCILDDIGLTIDRQFAYHTRDIVLKASHMHTWPSQSFWPLPMIPSFFLLFHIAWCLPRWWPVPGTRERGRSLQAKVYTIYPSLCYKADKLIIGRFQFSIFVGLPQSNGYC
jgi:hypothetical protein